MAGGDRVSTSAIFPSPFGINANAHALARYAALCQEAGLVPIVEPEVLMDGAHGIERCEVVTAQVLQAVFAELDARHVLSKGMLLKPNMVIAGKNVPRRSRASGGGRGHGALPRRLRAGGGPGDRIPVGRAERVLATRI